MLHRNTLIIFIAVQRDKNNCKSPGEEANLPDWDLPTYLWTAENIKHPSGYQKLIAAHGSPKQTDYLPGCHWTRSCLGKPASYLCSVKGVSSIHTIQVSQITIL